MGEEHRTSATVTLLASSPDRERHLITLAPKDRFDPDNGMVVLYLGGTGQVRGPMTLQAALTHAGPWQEPAATDVTVELTPASRELLDRTRLR